MPVNYHTHTTFCDGKNTPEEIVLYAIENGFSAIGFSGHGHTPFDLRYCMKDVDGYIEEISRLKIKYGNRIQIYCGIEEDALAYVDRKRFDYLIGSLHYLKLGGEYCSLDWGYDSLKKCLRFFDDDVARFAEEYYSTFTDYIEKRKPDIVGHFDLITKFDEMDVPLFADNGEYLKVAEKYMCKAAENDVIFEVNTGAIARGIKKAPYPCEQLLYILKKKGSKIIISSDSHRVETLSCHFEETEKLLRDIGFGFVYELDNGEFRKRNI